MVAHISSVVIVLGLLGVIWFRLARRPTDPFAVFVLVFGVFYGFRAILLSLNLDSAHPDYLFLDTDLTQAAIRFHWGLSVFLLTFIFAGILVRNRQALVTPGALYLSEGPSRTALLWVTFALTALSALISIFLLSRFGGIGGMITATKVSGELAGLYFLKIPMAIGAIVATASFLELRSFRKSSLFTTASVLGCAAFNSVMVFAWGQRSIVVIVVAMLVLWPSQGKSRRQSHGMATFLRVGLAALLVVGISMSLRDARDDLTETDGVKVFSEQSDWRRLSQGVNGIYYDASLLAFRDWPSQFEYRDGRDFFNGVAGTIPRRVWAQKPDPLPGKWFRQVYEPEARNGWPTGAPTIWYLNFGWSGLMLGGAISGAIVGAVSRRSQVADENAMNAATTFVVLVYPLQLGWSSDSLLVGLTWIAPLMLVNMLLRRTKAQSVSHTERRGVGR